MAASESRMKEILPGVFHWVATHPDIGEKVDSYFVEATNPPILIDPLLPAGGIEAFDGHVVPRHVYLTNRLHFRDSAAFQEAFDCKVWCHKAGLHEFASEQSVYPFHHGDALEGGLNALKVGVLCPEETALHMPLSNGILVIGDALVRWGEALGFVPDWLIGEDPQAVKRGIRDTFLRHLNLDFDHILFAHGRPWIGGAKEGLRQYLENLIV